MEPIEEELCDRSHHSCSEVSHPCAWLKAYVIPKEEFDQAPGTTAVYLQFEWRCEVRKWYFFEVGGRDDGFGGVGYARRLKPVLEEEDWGRVRRWVDGCAERHEGDCLGLKATKLAGFVVIDCKMRALVPVVEGVGYEALSYVWGSARSKQEMDGVDKTSSCQLALPNPFPEQVIEDALICALKLNIPYLWVDRYCIDQQDSSSTKQRLIQSMDEIYSAAKITLVCVAGADATTGLPGVSTTQRNSVSVAVIYGHRVVEVPNPRNQINNSKWITRGWTLQEGLLARRRLVFTDTQVYFQCRASHCMESVLGAFKSKRVMEARSGDPSGPRRSTQTFPSLAIGSSNYSVVEVCNEMSKRALTNDEDALRACLGILARLWKAETPAYHYAGLPLFGKSGASLAESLFWTARLPVGAGSRSPLVRRTWGPSWSWLAWRSSIGFERGIWLGDPAHVRMFATICVQKADERRPSRIGEYIEDINNGGIHQAWLPYIELTSWLATLCVEPDGHDSTSQSCYVDGEYVGHADLLCEDSASEWLSVMIIA